MKKIRVIHLITKLELGGAQRNTIFTCENLDRNRFDVYLMSGEGGILTPDPLKMGEDKNGGKVVFVKDLVREINPLRDFKAYRFLLKEIRRIRPDIVHTHSSKAGIIGRLAAKRAKVPVVIHSVHGFSFSPRQSLLKRTLFGMIEQCISRITDHFIFVSEGDLRSAEKLGLLKRSAYSLIRSGFDFSRFKAGGKDPAAMREKYDIRNEDFVCGVIAPFKPQKGLMNLIKIASIVLSRDRNVVFFIAGDGTLRDRIEMELVKRGIRGRFVLPGFIHDIEDVIPMFDIGVSTALWEGLPQSLVQFRLMKIPVVATDISGNNEIIKNGINGYTIDVNDFDTFAERILYLKANSAERRSLAEFREDLGDWDGVAMVRSQDELYRSLINGRGS